MHPADSAATFQAAVTASGLTVAELNASEALTLMTAFYRDVRAENCILDEEGDTLVCEWGLRDQGQEPGFQLELTRHFIEPGDEDEDGMSQLSLTLQYVPAASLRALEPATHQCSSPAELAEFEKAILVSPAYRVLATLKPQQATLQWCLL